MEEIPSTESVVTREVVLVLNNVSLSISYLSYTFVRRIGNNVSIYIVYLYILLHGIFCIHYHKPLP